MLWVSRLWTYETEVSHKTIGNSKALSATLSDIEPEDDSNNENDRILNAFTTIVDPTDGIVEEIGRAHV